jgi:serine/threonine protein kinase
MVTEITSSSTPRCPLNFSTNNILFSSDLSIAKTDDIDYRSEEEGKLHHPRICSFEINPTTSSPEVSHTEKMVNNCVELFHQLENENDCQLNPSFNFFIESYQALPLVARARVENWFIEMDDIKTIPQENVGIDAYRATFFGVDVSATLYKFNASEESEALQTEIRAMAQLRHPNIVSFLGANISCEQCTVVTECMPLGSLRGFYLSKQGQQRGWRPSKGEALAWALDLARAVTYLHSSDPSVTHRDIRPETLFIASSGSLKVSGFGRCALLPRRPLPRPAACAAGPASRRPCAPIEDPYAAPELRGDCACADPGIDVFATAAVVRFLRAGRDPLAGGDRCVSGPGCLGRRRGPGSLAAVLAAAASADPADRPAADALMAALEEGLRLCRAACRVS